jgi:hypothetical protein
MPKLNQIVAVEKGAKSVVENEITKAYHLAQKAEVFNGIERKYQPKDEEGEQLPGESQKVITTVPELVQAFSVSLTKLFDVTATKTYANTGAKADVKVDGEVLLEQVPIEYLLFLEKRLGDTLVFLGKLPTLDPSLNWTYDAESGQWKADKVTTHRTKKLPFNHIKSPATDKHPAQVDVLFEDVTVGFWDTTKVSGAVPATQIKEWKEKVLKLQAAVKFAREEANSMEVENVKVGEKVFSYLFNGLHA